MKKDEPGTIGCDVGVPIVDILLVEDNPRDAEMTIRALRRRNLANPIFHAEDGVQALDFVFCRNAFASRDLSRPPRVVLLDLKLPRLDGLAVLREIKSDDRTRTIPVVVVSSSAEDPDIRAAYSLGANGYVVKPVQFDAFLTALGDLGLYWLLINEAPR